MGRLVSDPELKTTPSGVSVTTFRIAVDRNYVKSGEERKADFLISSAGDRQQSLYAVISAKARLLPLKVSFRAAPIRQRTVPTAM